MPFDNNGRFVMGGNMNSNVMKNLQLVQQPSNDEVIDYGDADISAADVARAKAAKPQLSVSPQFRNNMASKMQYFQQPQNTGPVQPAAPPQPVMPQAPQQYIPYQAPQQYYPQYYSQPQQQQYYQPQYQQQPVQQSVTQSVNNRNPQSVSNFLTALNRAGAGGNNAQFNGQGQQGQQAQAGYGAPQQQLGYQGYQGYTGAMPSQVGYQYNQAQQGNAGYAQNGSRQGQYGQANAPQTYGGGGMQGGRGGVQGQPQWQTPGQWGQPLNNPAGTQGSAFDQEHSADQLFAAPSPSLGGSFYSNGVPGPGGIAPLTMEQQQANAAHGPWTGDPSLAPDTPYDPVSGTYGGPTYHYPVNTNVNANQPNVTLTSDENAKTNITSGEGDLQEFLDALGAYSYDYKDKAHGEKTYVSPMAQELEKSKIGQSAIVVDPKSGYKQVNYARIAGAQLSATALVNNKVKTLDSRVKELEAKLAKAVSDKFKGIK